jgi:hypothetical protein
VSELCAARLHNQTPAHSSWPLSLVPVPWSVPLPSVPAGPAKRVFNSCALDIKVLLNQWVNIRTRVQNTLQALALNHALRRGRGLWTQAGQTSPSIISSSSIRRAGHRFSSIDSGLNGEEQRHVFLNSASALTRRVCSKPKRDKSCYFGLVLNTGRLRTNEGTVLSERWGPSSMGKVCITHHDRP